MATTTNIIIVDQNDLNTVNQNESVKEQEIEKSDFNLSSADKEWVANSYSPNLSIGDTREPPKSKGKYSSLFLKEKN